MAVYLMMPAQLTMSASFVPKLPAMEVRRPPATFTSNGNLSAPPTSATLAPPTPGHFQLGPPRASPSPTNPPITPNPFPAMSSEEEQYANVEGVVVWEGKVEESKAGNQGEDKNEDWHPWGRRVFRRNGAWEVIWKGEIPIGMSILLVSSCLAMAEGKSSIRPHKRRKPCTLIDGLGNSS